MMKTGGAPSVLASMARLFFIASLAGEKTALGGGSGTGSALPLPLPASSGGGGVA